MTKSIQQVKATTVSSDKQENSSFQQEIKACLALSI